MMKIGIVSFTDKGRGIAERLSEGLGKFDYEMELFSKQEDLSDWIKGYFEYGGGLIFVGATGIAVRMIAPWLKGKDRDPAVVVVDETGRFSISLLSGHLGGANELTEKAAKVLSALSVITTATDLNGKFAADLFAARNDLWLRELPLAKEISSAVLRGEKIGFFCDFPVEGPQPEELTSGREQKYNICVSEAEAEDGENMMTGSVLYLIPRRFIIGIGCKKGMPEAELEKAVIGMLARQGIERQTLSCIASIDIKREEPGLLALTAGWRLPFHTYSAEQLLELPGAFTDSEFVKEITGVSNVCERAALCACEGQGRLLAKKTVFSGVTVAVAEKNIRLRY